MVILCLIVVVLFICRVSFGPFVVMCGCIVQYLHRVPLSIYVVAFYVFMVICGYFVYL